MGLSERDKVFNYKHIMQFASNLLEPVSIKLSGAWKYVILLVSIWLIKAMAFMLIVI